MRLLMILLIAFSSLGITFITEYRYEGKEVTITGHKYSVTTDITKADSVVMLAMILNRECPTCPFEEKVYLASCFVTGARVNHTTIRDYVLNYGQVWDFKDSRLYYKPSLFENVQAAQAAIRNPKKVRFYAHERDNPAHYKPIFHNAVYRANHVYAYTY